LTESTLMPLMRDITWVTSSNSSRDRQRSTGGRLFADAQQHDGGLLHRRHGAAHRRGASVLGFIRFGHFLHPLFDDFGHAFRLLAGQHFR
jgi:hypothetical protein